MICERGEILATPSVCASPRWSDESSPSSASPVAAAVSSELGLRGIDQEVHLKFVAERLDKLDLGVERVARRSRRERCIGKVLRADADDDLAVAVSGQPGPRLSDLLRQASSDCEPSLSSVPSGERMASNRFIAGEPMKAATKRLSGCS